MIRADRLREMGLDANDADQISGHINARLEEMDPADCWGQIRHSLLTANHPFEVHQYICDALFEQWEGPRPIWSPSQEVIANSNLDALMRKLSISDYPALHRWSVNNRETFWEMAIKALDIRFTKYPSQILDLSEGVGSPRWLVGAQLNIVDSCFLAGDDTPAIVFDSISDGVSYQTVGQLRSLTNQVSNALRKVGFAPGDAIAINMPMTPDSVAIYLGIVQMGGIVISIADSFAAPEIATRLNIGGAKAIFTMSHILRGGKRLPLYDKVVASDPDGRIQAIVIDGGAGEAVSLRPNDRSWSSFLSDNFDYQPHMAAPDRAINVLFSSGTTGDPKAIPWDHTTAIKCAVDGHYHQDIHPGNVVAWPTNLGWMMGPWLIFATLINRGTIALFSDLPTSRSFGQFVQDAKVNVLGVVPSMVRQWRETECMKGLDWSNIHCFSSTGECSSQGDMFYLMHLAGYRPIIEYCGGTEIGGGYITSTVVQPNAPATFSSPALGIDLVILDDEGAPADTGELFLIPPSVGLSTQLLNRDHHEVYFEQVPPGPSGETLRRHGDHFQRFPRRSDEEGVYYRALGRVDDTMNLSGVKVGSAEIERVLNRVDGVAESAAVAIAPPDGGPSQLVIFTVLDPISASAPDTLRSQMQNAIKRELNPLFRIHDVCTVDALPRTASNKVMRRELRAAYQAEK